MADVEHRSTFKDGHQGWQPGTTCTDCELRKEMKRAELHTGKPPNYVPPIGTQSLVDTMQEFWHTGDPDVFDQRTPAQRRHDSAAAAERMVTRMYGPAPEVE